MTRYYVNVLRRAQRDSQAIVDWLTTRSPAGARRWEGALREALVKLAENPDSYGEAPERVRPPTKIRQILFKTPKGKYYRAVFIIVDEEVRVLRIRRPHQRVMRRRDMPGL
jgi:plasmid stabilization system protein ParE